MNLALWLYRNALAQGSRPAVALGCETVYDYAAFAHAACGFADWARQQGLQAGDRVGLFMDNRPDYLVAWWGLWWMGVVAVPMNARLHGREAGWILAQCGAKACLVDERHAAELQPHRGDDVRLWCQPVTPITGALQSPVECHEDDPAWLFYTSGTTGRPKGVTLTHRNLRWAAMAYVATVQPVTAGDSCLHPAPLSHGSGMYHLAYVMNAGVNVIPASGGLDATEFFSLAAHWRNASCFAAPTIVRRLAEHVRVSGVAVDGLATIVYGGAPMYLADLEAAREALGPHLAQIYGQGESPMTITVLPKSVIEDRGHPRWRERMASVGLPQPMVEVTIRGTDGGVLTPGLIGEVCVRGDVVMTGYWQNPEATASALRDGWLWTGDIGRLDEEGFLTLLDRSKDLVISGGNNVYPREVEEVLLMHPAVAEVSVIGRPDPEWGETVVAYVVTTAAVASAELDAHCLDHIARYKRPKAYRFVQDLPKNNYGKVLKTELREQEALRPPEGQGDVR
ncbi:MAG: AMP-binding protein [Rubrivivax sp.]|nr:AMP-binding protein [Rubrivivax sp.]MBK8528181.1 AMP-binding protein [Rubrivivax sp.]